MSDWIDITQTLRNGMVQWPSDRPFVWTRTMELAGAGTANVSEIRTCLHVGTHIDAPLHFIADGQDVASIPLSVLCGRAVVVEITERRDITAADLAGARRGERLLLRTPNGSLWRTGAFDQGFHALSEEAAQRILDIGVPVVGVDYLSVDRFDTEDSPVHQVLLGGGIPIIEGLDLQRVSPGRYEMVALPLKISQADGSPARVIIRSIES